MPFQFHILHTSSWLSLPSFGRIELFPFVYRAKTAGAAVSVVYCFEFWWLYFACDAGCSFVNGYSPSNRRATWVDERGRVFVLDANEIGVRLATSATSSIYGKQGHSPQLAFECWRSIYFLCNSFPRSPLPWHEAQGGRDSETMRKSETKHRKSRRRRCRCLLKTGIKCVCDTFLLATAATISQRILFCFCYILLKCCRRCCLTFAQTGTSSAPATTAAAAAVAAFPFWPHCFAY